MAASWIDKLGFLNWIDWVEGLVRGAAYGDVTPHRITLHHPESDWWEENPGVPFWNMGDTKRLLESYHVTCFWHGFNDLYIWTHVKQDQARWAEYLLYRAGAPVIMTTVDSRNVTWASNPAHGGKMPGRWDDRETHTAPDWAERE